ncbi:MAG: hypothetical protein R3F28_12460 [Candidatus Kapaibacterium sp.]
MNGRYLYCMAFLLLAGTPATAQYSEAAFEQKQAGELYDERGFMHGKAITVQRNWWFPTPTATSPTAIRSQAGRRRATAWG